MQWGEKRVRQSFLAVLLILAPSAHAAPSAYIPNSGSANVSVIDIATNSVIGTVAVGVAPQSVAVRNDGTRVYVANAGSNDVSVIDTATNTVVATVALGASTGPRGVAVNSADTHVYVTNGAAATVSVIDTATNTVVATVAVGPVPRGVAVNPAGTRVYVANGAGNNVSVIDAATNTVVANVTVEIGPSGVSLNPAGTHAYVANENSNTVSTIDTTTNTVVATVAVGSLPQGVAVNSAGTRAYVVNNGSNNVSVIDTATNTVVTTVAVISSPFGIDFNPTGTRAYVANRGSRNVSVIDTATNTVVATVPVALNFTTNLEVGYNLIGNSFNTTLNVVSAFGNADAPVAAVTPNILSIWKWNAVAGRWTFYSPQLTVAGNASFAASKNYDVLATINPGEGYWVYAVTQMSLPAQAGTAFDWDGLNFAALPAGFKLITHADTVTPSQFNTGMNATVPPSGVVPTDNFLSLWAWDAAEAKWYFYSPQLESTGGLAAVKAYADSHFYRHFQDFNKTLSSGVGFWVDRP